MGLCYFQVQENCAALVRYGCIVPNPIESLFVAPASRRRLFLALQVAKLPARHRRYNTKLTGPIAIRGRPDSIHRPGDREFLLRKILPLRRKPETGASWRRRILPFR